MLQSQAKQTLVVPTCSWSHLQNRTQAYALWSCVCPLMTNPILYLQRMAAQVSGVITCSNCRPQLETAAKYSSVHLEARLCW